MFCFYLSVSNKSSQLGFNGWEFLNLSDQNALSVNGGGQSLGIQKDLTGLSVVLRDGVAHELRGGRDDMVADADGSQDALDDGSDGGVCVSLNGRVGKVTTQTVGLDDGAVVSRSADQSGAGVDDGGVGSGQAYQKDGDLLIGIVKVYY